MPGYEGCYEVSDQGRVRSLRNTRGRPAPPRLLKPSPICGYPTVSLSVSRVIKKRAVHALVAEAFIGPRREGQQTRHRDGDRSNPRLTNLCYGSQSDNMQDAVRHGTHANASKTHCPKGHEYTPENTYIRPDFYARMCRACLRARKR